MTPPRRRGRRVPPKHGARQFPPPPSGTASGGTGGPAGPAGESTAPTEPVRPLSRSKNRAAKRAASGITPGAPRRVAGRRGYNPALLGLAIAAIVVVAAVFALGNPFGGPGASGSPEASATPAATRILTGCPTAAPAGLPAGEKRTVTIATVKGDIVLEVEADLAPVAAANFIALAECGYYDDVVFHRIIPDFVIQAGDGQYAWAGALDKTQAGQGGPGYEFDDEPVNGSYTRGTVAMANSGADTNGSQFFIMVKDSTTLPKSYVIFGHVTAGMDVVDQIVSAPRDANDFPDDPVAMTTVTVAPAPSPSPSTAASAAPSAPPETPTTTP